jgi:hypothetical protein
MGSSVMKSPKGDQDAEFDPAESKRRFEAALKGAQIAGHVPMKEKPKAKKAAKKSGGANKK